MCRGVCACYRITFLWRSLVCGLSLILDMLSCEATCVSSWLFRNPVSTKETAGFVALLAAMPLMCFLSGCLRNRLSTWGMAGLDVP